MDGVAYQDELDDLVPVLRRGGEAVDWIEAEDYGAGGDGVRLRRRPRIAVLYAVGTIVSGRSGFDATDGDLVGSEPSSRTSAASATIARSAASCCASTARADRRWPPTSSCAS